MDQSSASPFRVATDPSRFESAAGGLDTAVSHLQAAVIPHSQESSRDEILRFCEAHNDALYRSSLTGHLTASAFVVDVTSSSVALIHHRKLDRWLQPGGHADGEGNLLLVAATEVAEEIGLSGLSFVLPAFDIDIHAIPERGEVPAHHHLDLRFLALADGTPDITGNDETNDAGWVPLGDARMNDGVAVRGAAGRAVELAAALG